jgi:type I restriction enzyme S subunit
MTISHQTNGQKTVPTLWRERILKRNFEISLGKMLQSDQNREEETEELYLRSANVQWEGVDLSDVKTMWFSPAEKRDLLLRDGDLVVNEGGDVGRCAIWCAIPEVVYFQNAINRVRARTKASTRFLYYWLYNLKHAGFIDAMVSRITIAHLTAEKLARVPWPDVPSIEQQRIAAYLDASCAAIDSAVAAKRSQLETLGAVRTSIIEMAVTRGINGSPKLRVIDQDWIGSLPAHWAAVRIKRVISRLDYGISVSSEPEGKYPVLKMGNIQSGEIVFSKMEFVDEVADELLLDHNDLLYNRTNSPDQVGKAALFLGTKDDAVTFASYLVRLRVNHRVIPEFLNFAVNCGGFLAFARRLAIPSVQQSNLNSTRYGRLHIPLPPVNEQLAICEHLTTKVGELMQVVTTIETQITTLNAYRKSLIHECVTGQRRITEADLNRVKAHG